MFLVTNPTKPVAVAALLFSAACSGSTSGAGPSTEFLLSANEEPRVDGGIGDVAYLGAPQRPEVCAVLRSETNAVLAHASEHEALYRQNRDRLQVFGTCFRTSHGAWAVMLESVEPVVRDMGAVMRLQGHWMLTHADDEGGHRVTKAPAVPSEGQDFSQDPMNFIAGHPTAMRIQDPAFFDYDGDGEPEALVVVSEETAEYGTVVRGRVWTFRHNAIELLNGARDIVATGFRDIDNDRRPDLTTYGPYVGEWGDFCARRPTAVHGPALVAHAVAGGAFSLTDEPALSATKASCPERPAQIVAPGDNGGVDSVRTAHNVACARLWGASANEVVAAVQTGCRRGRRDPQRCVAGCNDVGMLVRWARMRPPLRLH